MTCSSSTTRSTQEEFFHTFNDLVDNNRQLCIRRKSPSDLEGMEERLRSRLGLVADIHATTYELRLGILQSKKDEIGAVVPDKVLEFLAHKITSSVRELEGALNRVAAHASLIGREVTLETVKKSCAICCAPATVGFRLRKSKNGSLNILISGLPTAIRPDGHGRWPDRARWRYLAKQLTSRRCLKLGGNSAVATTRP